MKLWKEESCRGTTVFCQIGRQIYTESFASPPESMDHACLIYLRNRFPIIRTNRRMAEFKRQYKLLFSSPETEKTA